MYPIPLSVVLVTTIWALPQEDIMIETSAANIDCEIRILKLNWQDRTPILLITDYI